MKQLKFGHLLVVEDNEDTQLLLRYLLDPWYDVTIVTRVDEALAEMAEQRFVLLLVDINLGEERSGVDLLNIVRETPDYSDTPLLAITAYAMPGDYQRFLAMGFDGYLSKPFTRKELYAAIDALLGHDLLEAE